MGSHADKPLVVVGGIPPQFRSQDLRMFFSSAVEEGAFACFHYLHRTHVPGEAAAPEDQDGRPCKRHKATGRSVGEGRRRKLGHTLDDAPLDELPRACALVALASPEVVPRIVAQYDGRVWETMAGTRLVTLPRCSVREFRPPAGDPKPARYVKRGEARRLRRRQREAATPVHLLPDLNPPPGLERGNVGTRAAEMARSARGGVLPRDVALRYGVPRAQLAPDAGVLAAHAQLWNTEPHAYAGGDHGKGGDAGPRSSSQHHQHHHHHHAAPRRAERLPRPAPGARGDHEERALRRLNIEERMVRERARAQAEHDEEAEEWDNHLAAEGQDFDEIRYGRDERHHYLYEENMEVVWEKGGSGLVFHTDEVVWERLRGDLDEQWADGFEVDGVAVHQDESDNRPPSPPPSPPPRRLAREPGQGEGEKEGEGEGERGWWAGPAGRKSVAHSVMEAMGWKQGQGLGRHGNGIANAITPKGTQRRRGLGWGAHGQPVHQRGRTAGERRVGERAFGEVPCVAPPRARDDEGSFGIEDDRLLELSLASYPRIPLASVLFARSHVLGRADQ